MNEILIEKVESVDTEDCDIENLKETVSKFLFELSIFQKLVQCSKSKIQLLSKRQLVYQ